RIDVVSAGLIAAGLVAVVYACSQAVPHGWSSPQVIAPLAVGLAGVALFLVVQAHRTSPLLPLHIVAHRSRAGAYLAVSAAVVGSFGMFLMLTYHFQVILGYSPLQAGLAFLPLTVAVSSSAYGISSRLLPHVQPKTLIVPGLLVAAAGLALLTQLDAASGYVSVILPAQVLLGLGMGCVFTPAISIATSDIDHRDAGIAAAVANTAMQIGGSVGTAVLNTVAITATAAYVSAHAATAAVARDALVHGYAAATTWAAVLLGVVAAVIAVMIRPPHPDTTVPTGSPQRANAQTED
ncbi:MAG: MFS transporter, partial [Nocardioidaceae bacterium]